jgi:sec-independent protein translocase protein TatA
MVSQLALPEGGEWIILLAVVVVLFGANKLPDLTRNAARALVEYRKITSGEDKEPTKEPATGNLPAVESSDGSAESVGEVGRGVGQPAGQPGQDDAPQLLGPAADGDDPDTGRRGAGE